MTCKYCQFLNIEDEHRCRRCGRRLAGSATAAPAHLAQEHARLAVKVLGANALAAPNVREMEETSAALKQPQAIDTAKTMDELPRTRVAASREKSQAKSGIQPVAIQPTLFGNESQPKIIPFETIYRPAPVVISTVGGSAAAPAKAAVPKEQPRAARSSVRRKTADIDGAQATLDFLPPARGTAKTLKTSAEAVIFCDAMVATPIHRATAGVLDMSMVLVAFGAAVAIFQAAAQPVGIDRWALIALGALFGLATLFYGLLFAIAGCVTPGMRWTNLRLINFDGFPPDGKSRALRFIGYWISLASGGLGVLWALLDEENLTWHDHISKTFPTLTESESIVVRHRQR